MSLNVIVLSLILIYRRARDKIVKATEGLDNENLKRIDEEEIERQAINVA